MEPKVVMEGIKNLYPPDREKLPLVELVKVVVTVYTQKNPGELGIPTGLLTEDWYHMALCLDASDTEEVIFFYNVPIYIIGIR